jgi:hypothetical protein
MHVHICAYVPCAALCQLLCTCRRTRESPLGHPDNALRWVSGIKPLSVGDPWAFLSGESHSCSQYPSSSCLQRLISSYNWVRATRVVLFPCLGIVMLCSLRRNATQSLSPRLAACRVPDCLSRLPHNLLECCLPSFYAAGMGTLLGEG